MYIESIYLKNFRNYEEQSIKLCPGINIFFGDNAQGKTNVLESIYLTSMGKSHRTQKYNEMIKWDKDQCRVLNEYSKEGIEGSIDFFIKRNKKKQIKINGIKIDKLSEIIGRINSIMFSPDHMRIVKEGPSERRKFIDAILSQAKPKYYYNLIQYLKVLDQRNNLLSDDKKRKELIKTLDIWDYQLIDFGSKIIRDRFIFIKNIGNVAAAINNQLSGGKENLELRYKPSVRIESFEMSDIEEAFTRILMEARATDIMRGITNYGPHRDELILSINGKELRNYGSQGQQRSALLSLKLAETSFIKEETGTVPVLLLDDVFSELDINRQNYLLYYIKDMQVVLTCTDFNNINLSSINHCSYFEVKNGTIKEI